MISIDSQTENTHLIRVGVVGISRGMTFAKGGPRVGMDLVAVCDTWEERLNEAGQELGVATYTDYDAFLEHDLDAVVLANYFHEHAPFAIKALDAGKHVMSECAACHTLGEGVALARAIERSGCIYMLAENYPYMVYNQEMRRLFQEGTIGEFRYGEGEYVHPDSARVCLSRSPGTTHWRNWIPSTYYCTHSVAPVMYITDTRPVRVNGFVVPYDFNDPAQTSRVKFSDTAAAIMLRMDNGAVVKSLHGALRGHQNYVRIHGNKGMMENARIGDDKNMLRVHLAPHGKEQAEVDERVYLPEFPEHHEEATRAGHGGGDFFTNYHFAEAIRTGQQPYLDVYRAIDMSIVGILAFRSALEDGAPIDVPDFRDEDARKLFEDDQWTPDPTRDGDDGPASSVLGHLEPSEEAVRFSREVWADVGYDGD
ncbi:MAG: Gfo/Idh/MocA family oxidoreductase [bacterium]|nr:Gfo/Idh/MocA family oxidoreductase [bacterium]